MTQFVCQVGRSGTPERADSMATLREDTNYCHSKHIWSKRRFSFFELMNSCVLPHGLTAAVGAKNEPKSDWTNSITRIFGLNFGPPVD